MKTTNPAGLPALSTASLALAFAIVASGCTGHIPGSFRLAQQEQEFSSQLEINTKVDLLFVVDNSASMDVAQEKLRQGFAGFASKYLQPTWDIRVAVITTDTYLANPAFASFLDSRVAGTVGYSSPYINSRLASWQNPAGNPSLYNKATRRFESGVRYRDLVPAWGPDYARLLPGIHDGPVSALCFEGHSYFIKGVTQCKVRDDQAAGTGVQGCLSPVGGESSVSQCVNTTQNDSVRSGRAIIGTLPPAGSAPTSGWTSQLVSDFTVNVTAGSSGHGSERGFASVLQLLSDNEGTETSLFRSGSLRGLVFVSDEEDQTLAIPSPVPAGYTPLTVYSTSCPPKTVDSHTYSLTLCPDPAKLRSVSGVKAELDAFFQALDGGASPEASWFVVSIVPLTGDAIQALHAQRQAEDLQVGAGANVSVDRGDRYIALGSLVGNGSLAMNIADSDYSPILDAIGRAIIEKKGTFLLARAPTRIEDMVVKVIHEDGSSETIDPSKLSISGKHLIISDLGVVLGFKSTDRININYQPDTVFAD